MKRYAKWKGSWGYVVGTYEGHKLMAVLSGWRGLKTTTAPFYELTDWQDEQPKSWSRRVRRF